MDIYKVNYLTNENTIHSIHVFSGKNKDKLESLFKKDPMSSTFISSGIFTQEELKYIQDNKIPVSFSQQSIHLDDSIGAIKWKIFQEFKETFCLNEIYLFAMREESIEPINIYQELTQNKKLQLTKIRLYNVLSNIVKNEQGQPVHIEVPEKAVYTYEDILALNLGGKKYVVNKSICQKIFLYTSEYPFVCNPFSLVGHDTSISKRAITTLNSHLLLNFGNIVGNNIYLCLAKDVLSQQGSDVEKLMELYFPFLHEEEIVSLQDLEEKRADLIEKNKKKQKDSRSFQDVDLFYDIYKERKSELSYKGRGIKSIKLVIHPVYKLKIPLLTVFKLLHATKDRPFIKYNPSTKQDKLLRLYTEMSAQDGRKIPFLQKEVIFRLVKTVGKNKTVSVYIKEWNGVCEFEENGNISISSEFSNAKSMEEVSDMIIEHVNPVIEEIQSYLEQNGYIISLFKTVDSPFVEIKQLTYETIIGINKKINLNSIKGCMSSIFITETVNSAKGRFVLRLKRVANFNKLNSMEAFIVEKQESGLRGQDIITELLENYKDLTENDAVELLKKMASELQVERGVRKNDIEIKVNPGFKIVLQVNTMTEDVSITVENINDMRYLETIPIYLDTLIRITQDKKSTRVKAAYIKSLCSGSEKEDIVLEDIVMPTEESFLKEEGVGEEEEEEGEEEKEKAKNALDIFFGDDDDQQEDDDSSEIIIGNEDDDESSEIIIGDENDDDEAEDREIEEEESELSSFKGGMSDEPEQEQRDEDYDSEPESINEEEEEQEPDTETIKNIDGLRLNNPYYFQDKIKKKEPRLILTEDQGKFNAYSRVCQPNTRTPVVITQQELNKIKKTKPGVVSEEAGDVIKYGSDTKNQNYYICPQYWDLKNETVITAEEIKEKNLQDKILAKNEKVVSKGKYIYQFYEEKPGNKMYPGFQVDSHPNGYCLPCCFSKWKTPAHISRRKQCSAQDNKPEETPAEKKADKQDYIKGPEKFPLANGRWGYLPIGVQQILKGDDNSSLKENKAILLRHGVETSKTQSFVACISDAIYYTKTDEAGNIAETSIKQMKQTIISTLTLDNFPTFQNGNLVTDFSLPTRKVDITLPPYKDAKIVAKLKKKPAILEKIASSFENFIEFLKNDTATIDYTYLWDIICKPNDKIFKDGVNLVVLDIPNKDTTANVQIICPTNHYAAYPYNSKRPTLILIRQDNYFEPVYSYRQKIETGNEPTLYIGKLFKEADAKIPKSVRSLFQNIVKPFYQQQCIPFSSMPDKYKMKLPLVLNVLMDRMREIGGYVVVRQIINYQGKAVGVIFKRKDDGAKPLGKIVVPCYPSAVIPTTDYHYMDEPGNWNTYENTVAFLIELYDKSDKKIPCKPAFKLVDDEVVVGILTESNQFVQVNPPVPISETNDSIPEMRGENYVLADSNIGSAISKSKGARVNDTERIEYIQKIKLETRFFDVFRNTIRMLLNDYKNISLREKIEQVVNAPYIIYQSKLEQATALLKQLVASNVVFVDNYDFKMINEVTTCLNKSAEKCPKEAPLCTTSQETNGCQMVLPKKNLVTGAANDTNYYLKMADELIRYSRIKSFVFEPKSYLSFRSLDYNIRENEVILMQSLLTQDYFKSMVPLLVNKYVKYKSRDNA